MDIEQGRMEDVLIFVVGLLDELKADGLVAGGGKLTAEGHERFVLLKIMGFQPTPEEISLAMQTLLSAGQQ